MALPVKTGRKTNGRKLIDYANFPPPLQDLGEIKEILKNLFARKLNVDQW